MSYFDKNFVLGALASASSVLILQQLYKSWRISQLKSEISQQWEKELSFQSAEPGIDENELTQEQLSRNIAFLGQENVKKLCDSFVIVVGLGGVGSHAAHMLLRAGVRNIRLIDFDQVTLSSLNRHAVATRSDVGIPKVTAMKNHLLEILPSANIDNRVQMFSLKDADSLLAGNPDFVLDCIDHLNTKVDLIKYCVEHNIKVLASMGAGAKADPSKIQIADLGNTYEDALARAVRQMLKYKGLNIKVPVVYSTEKPSDIKLVEMDESKQDERDQYSILPTFRSRIMPVLGPIPAMFGVAMASYVITELANYPTEPIPFKVKGLTETKLYIELCAMENTRVGHLYQILIRNMKILLNRGDLSFIYEDTWKCRSAVSGILNRKLVLIRWDPSKDANFGNMVLLTKKEAEEHLQLSPEEINSHYSPEIIEYINKRFAREKRVREIYD